MNAAVAAVLVLMAVNAVLWDLVFPGGLPENYVYPRPGPMIQFEFAALIATALLLVAVHLLTTPAVRGWRAAGLGAVLGLLASAPAQLLIFATVRSDPRRNAIHVLWTAASWALTSTAIGWCLNRRPHERSTTDHQR